MKRKAEERQAVQHRCDIYKKLLDMSKISEVSCDMSKADDLVMLLDAGKFNF